MKPVIGLVGLLVTLVVVGLLAKRVLQTPPAAVLPTPAPDATVRPPSQNTPQQFKQAVEGALATPRPAEPER